MICRISSSRFLFFRHENCDFRFSPNVLLRFCTVAATSQNLSKTLSKTLGENRKSQISHRKNTNFQIGIRHIKTTHQSCLPCEYEGNRSIIPMGRSISNFRSQNPVLTSLTLVPPPFRRSWGQPGSFHQPSVIVRGLRNTGVRLVSNRCNSP